MPTQEKPLPIRMTTTAGVSLFEPVSEETPRQAFSGRAGTQPAPDIVQLTGPRGVCVHGILTGISGGSLHLELAVAVDSGIPVEVRIPFCRPFHGQVMYCKRREGSFHTSVLFSTGPTAFVEIGARTWFESLSPNCPIGSCPILDRAEDYVSVACRATVPLGAWVRMNLEAAVLFGEVTSIVPMTDWLWAVGVHVDATLSRAGESTQLAGGRS